MKYFNSKKITRLPFLGAIIFIALFLMLTIFYPQQTQLGDVTAVNKNPSVISESEVSAREDLFGGETSLAQNFTKAKEFLFLDESYLYALKSDVIEIYDISDYTSPTLIGTFTLSGSTLQKILVIDDLLFITSSEPDNETAQTHYYLYILNCSNPENLSVAARYEQPNKILTFGFYRGHLLLISDSVHIYNLTSPTTLSWFWSAYANNTWRPVDFAIVNSTLFVVSNYYLSSYALGNFSVTPKALYNYTADQSLDWFTYSYDYSLMVINETLAFVFAQSENNAFFVFNISNPLNISRLSSGSLGISTVFGLLQYTSGYLYLSNSETLYIFKFESFHSLTLISSYQDILNERFTKKYSFEINTLYNFVDIAFKDSTLFLWRFVYTPETYLLYVLDVSNVVEPVLLYRAPFTPISSWISWLNLAVLLIIPSFGLALLIIEIRKTVKRERSKPISSSEIEREVSQDKPAARENAPLSSRIPTKILASGYLLFVVQNSLLLLFFIITSLLSSLNSNDKFTTTYSAYFLIFLSVPLYLDLVAGGLLAAGFAWDAISNKSKSATFSAVLWLCWVIATLLYRLYWGLPDYSELTTLFYGTHIFQKIAPWLRHWELNALLYGINLVLFSLSLFFTERAFLKQAENSTKNLHLLYVFGNWAAGVGVLFALKNLVYTVLIQHGLIFSDGDLIYSIILYFALIAKIILLTIIAIGFFLKLYRAKMVDLKQGKTKGEPINAQTNI
ncbi:MAG: hypothetical protein ACTSXO_12545 [Candidatus Heimdallarchaeota archaeon]